MKTWPEWLELWKAAMSEFGTVTPPPLPATGLRAEWEQIFDKLEKETRDDADQACIYWVDRGTWPEMSEITRWFVLLRLCTAADVSIAVMYSSMGIPAIVWAPHMDDRTAALWLLNEAWVAGRGRYKEKICGIADTSRNPPRAGKN